MANITKIKATIITGDVPAAGTDGNVYLGICGREFNLKRVDAPPSDFERASTRDYVLGSSSNVQEHTFNDPRLPQLDTADADRHPTYIRFEPSGNNPAWNLDGVEVTITPGGERFGRLGGANGANLWLGQDYGKLCYLRRL
jgi:hypothetical protein